MIFYLVAIIKNYDIKLQSFLDQSLEEHDLWDCWLININGCAYFKIYFSLEMIMQAENLLRTTSWSIQKIYWPVLLNKSFVLFDRSLELKWGWWSNLEPTVKVWILKWNFILLVFPLFSFIKFFLHVNLFCFFQKNFQNENNTDNYRKISVFFCF